MAKVEFNIVINRPVEEVFAFLSNNENFPKWASGIVEVKKTSEGPIGMGTTWRTVSAFLGQRIKTESEVTEYEPNRKYTHRSKSGPLYQNGWSFERVEGGTAVKLVTEMEPRGFFKLAVPIVLRLLKRRFDTDLAHLKGLMNAHAL
jgi:uncharacterized membrane protein